MILNFKERFVDPIILDTKIHSIREDKHNRWKPGMQIHFATGERTKNYNCFDQGICVSIQKFELRIQKYPAAGPLIFIDDVRLHFFDYNRLAKNDGFEDKYDFFNFFKKGFIGKIIHWPNFKYK